MIGLLGITITAVSDKVLKGVEHGKIVMRERRNTLGEEMVCMVTALRDGWSRDQHVLRQQLFSDYAINLMPAAKTRSSSPLTGKTRVASCIHEKSGI